MALPALIAPAWSLLQRVPWQIWAIVGLAAAFWWHGYQRYEAGVAAERAAWELTVAEANTLADAKARAKEDADRAHNAEVRSRYEADLAAIRRDRDGLARRLRDHEAAAARQRVPEVADRPAVADATPEPPGPRGPSAVDAALDLYDAACRADALQLNALIEQLQPQLQ